MAKLETREIRVLALLRDNIEGLSCAIITDKLAEQELADIEESKKQYYSSTDKHYMSGSVSSLLARMIKQEKLKYSDIETTRGGYIYKLK